MERGVFEIQFFQKKGLYPPTTPEFEQSNSYEAQLIGFSLYKQ